MGTTALTDEALLAGGDPAAFERFYVAHVETLLGLLRPPHAGSRARRRPDRGDVRRGAGRAAAATAPRPVPASAWLYGIAMHKLTDAQRRGYAERRARRRHGHGAARARRRGLRADRVARRGGGRDRAARAARRPTSATRCARTSSRAAATARSPHRSTPPRRSCASASAAGSPRSANGWDTTMREDFVTRLQLQLRDAAEREARGSTLGQALRGARWRLGSPALAGAVAAVALVLAVGAGALLLRDEPRPGRPARRRHARADRQPRAARARVRLGVDRRPGRRRRRARRPRAPDRDRAHPGRRDAAHLDDARRRRAVGDRRAAAPSFCGSTRRRTASRQRSRCGPRTAARSRRRDVLANDRAVWAVSRRGRAAPGPAHGRAKQHIVHAGRRRTRPGGSRSARTRSGSTARTA